MTEVRPDAGKTALKPESRLPENWIYLFVKKCFDVLVALIATVIIALPLCILCLFIMIADFGSPFYMQMRVGKDGEKLPVLKLRSMKKGADNITEMLSANELEEYLREFKLKDDSRLIGWRRAGDGQKCFGAQLRRMSLDELPQIFWNILVKGNMSVVGPRPILQEELERNYTPEEQKLFLSVKPGLTGYWQAYARNNATYQTGERQRMELYYVQHRSLWLDVKILFATVGAVLRKTGAK